MNPHLLAPPPVLEVSRPVHPDPVAVKPLLPLVVPNSPSPKSPAEAVAALLTKELVAFCERIAVVARTVVGRFHSPTAVKALVTVPFVVTLTVHAPAPSVKA